VDDNVASVGLKVRGYGLELYAPVTEIKADPGSSNDFQLILSNRGNTADNFTLDFTFLNVSAPDAGWTAGTQSPASQVPEGVNSTVHAFVAPPARATPSDNQKLRIRATSEGNSTYNASVELDVTVNHLYAVNITASAANVWVFPGVMATFPVEVDNSGNGKDAISFSLYGTPLGWQASLSEDYSIIPEFSSMNITMMVVPPSNAPGLSRSSIDIRANYDNGRTATGTVTMHVYQVPRLELELADGPDTEDPGGNASYVLRVRNGGNGADPFVILADLPKGWTGEFSGVQPVAAGDFELVDFKLSIPTDAPAGEQEFTLTVVSGINSSVMSGLPLVIEVNQVYGVELSSDQTRTGLETGNSTRIEATVNNTGNGDDIIFFESEDSLPAGWRVTFMPTQINLPAGGTTTIVIKVRPPSNATEGSYFFSARATSSGNSLKAASLRFRMDLTNPPAEPVTPPVNNTRPPQYTGPPPPAPPDRLTRLLSSSWFLPMVLLALVLVSAASAGVWRARRKKRLLAEEPGAAPPEAMSATEEPIEILEMTEAPAKAPIRSSRSYPPAKPPAVAPPEPAGPAVMPILKSEAYESELETVDSGPPVPAHPIKPPPRARPVPPPKAEAAAQRAKMAGKTVDADIDDILSRIDGITGKKR
jgi:uncharacterized membrane protein